MTKKQTSKLRQDYNNAVLAYVAAFCKKQGFEYPDEHNIYWTGEVGIGVLGIGDYFFNIDNIIEDINNGYKKGLILEWHNDTVDASFDKVNQSYFDESPFINLKSYAAGQDMKC